MTQRNPTNLYGVVRRAGLQTWDVARALERDAANAMADKLQAENPNEEYAVVQLVYVRWTKPQAGNK